MSSTANTRKPKVDWRCLATMVVIACVLVISAQGCCSYCKQPVTHAIAFGVDTTKCPCPDATCVCPVPDVIKVHRGDKVRFVNTSPYDVTITPAVATAFNEGSPIVVASGATETVTVSNTAAVDTGIALNMAIAAPGTLCPGLPGPRMDVERD